MVMYYMLIGRPTTLTAAALDNDLIEIRFAVVDKQFVWQVLIIISYDAVLCFYLYCVTLLHSGHYRPELF